MAEEKSVKELEEELERLQKLVFFDDLTGILNRRGFREEIGKVFDVIFPRRRQKEERRSGLRIPLCFIFVDLDDFKKVNDSYGHEAGDHVLREVAGVLRKHLRSRDLFARWGGEEFVIALPGINIGTAKIVAEKLRRGIQNLKITVAGSDVKISASFGVINYGGTKTLSELIEGADKAMYEAKRLGKNRVMVFEN